MDRFEDDLWSELVRRNGNALADAPARQTLGRRMSRRTAAVVAVAAVAVCAVGVATGVLATSQGGSAAGAASSSPITPGTVAYREYVSTGSIGYEVGGRRWSVVGVMRLQWWIPTSGNGRSIQTCLSSTFASPAGKTAWRAEGSVAQLGAGIGSPACPSGTFPLFTNQLTPFNLSGLHPAEIAAALRSAAKQVPAHDVREFEFGTALEVVNAPIGTPAQKSAALAFAESIPGVLTEPNASDALGRTGIQLALYPNGAFDRPAEAEYLLDPRTLSVLDWSQTDPATGQVAFRRTLLGSGTVAAIGDRP
jgi:hypothetical protein